MKTVPQKSTKKEEFERFFENIANKITAVKKMAEDVSMNGLEKDPSVMTKSISPMYEASGTAAEISKMNLADRAAIERSRGIINHNINEIFKGKNS